MSNVQALPVQRTTGDRHAPPSVTLVVNVKVAEGDWSGYQRAVDAFRSKIPENAFSKDVFNGSLMLLPEWHDLFMEFKRSKLREYLGPTKIRSFKREPKILTDDLRRSLAETNFREREKREPYFVRIAALYAQIAELEWEMDTARGTR